MGCIETGSIPRFLFADNSIPIGPSVAPSSLPPGFESLAQSNYFDSHLLTLLSEVENYTYAIKSRIPSAKDLEPTAVHIRYRLLSWFDESLVTEQRSVVQHSVRCGTILYVESVLRKPSVRALDYTTLLSNLQGHLIRFESTRLTNLLLWLLFIAGSASGSPFRAWCVAKLLDVTAHAGIDTWDDAKLLLTRFWWIESIHEGPYQQLWDEVTKMRVDVS